MWLHGSSHFKDDFKLFILSRLRFENNKPVFCLFLSEQTPECQCDLSSCMKDHQQVREIMAHFHIMPRIQEPSLSNYYFPVLKVDKHINNTLKDNFFCLASKWPSQLTFWTRLLLCLCLSFVRLDFSAVCLCCQVLLWGWTGIAAVFLFYWRSISYWTLVAIVICEQKSENRPSLIGQDTKHTLIFPFYSLITRDMI